MRNTIICFLVVATLFSCTEELDRNLLAGRWNLDQFLKEDVEVNINKKEVYFEFKPGDIYTYHSTTNYEEAGFYYTDGDMLYTTDTLVSTPIKKSVKVILLNQDSLHFLMNDKGIRETLKLYRAK